MCINPHCDSIAHNCDKKETHCRDCYSGMVEINKETYQNKFIDNYFQYDYSNYSGDVVKPVNMGYNLQMSIGL